MQDREHTFTAAMTPGNHRTTVHGQFADIRRATDIGSLLDYFAHDLPRPINMTFIIDDNPAVMLSYGQRDRMVELAGLGECESVTPAVATARVWIADVPT